MMATASAVATPDSPDIRIPSQPSGLSSASRPVLSPTCLRNEATVSPGRLAAWAAPFTIGEVRFIALSRRTLYYLFETEIAATLVSWSPEWRLWFNAAAADL